SSRFELRTGVGVDASAPRRRTLRRSFIAALGIALGAGGTVLLVVVLAMTNGLLFVAGASGLVVGSQLRAGPAVALTLAGVLGGDVGAWLVARAEGGVLDLPAYAAGVFGIGLIGQVLVGALAAAYASSSIRSGR
ncbi:MAG: hypothetical protein L0221_08080, partial [Chloroflexi bacterium]|nr:hypothetical protein [Chloroflexota bacterium]